MKKIAEESFLNEVNQKADLIKRELRNVDEREDITGLGLMLGLKLKQKSAKQVAGDCLKNGLLVLTAKEKVRLLPPLTISDEELKKGLFVLKAVLES